MAEKHGELKSGSANSIQTYIQMQNESNRNEDFKKSQDNLLLAQQEMDDPSRVQTQDNPDQQGWISWAWSYVPSVTNILPLNESDASESQLEQQAPKQIEILIGFYVDEILVNFKVNFVCII